jgi:tRNA(Ser,Leu) C12 N-acetylase TAN1
MKDWNVVITTHMYQENRLMLELADLGEFGHSGFTSVVVGKVRDLHEFLETLRNRWEHAPFLYDEILGSVVPVRVMFPFTLESLLERLQEEALALGPELQGKAFYVRMKRRGHKGEISSQEIEQALDRFLKEKVCEPEDRCHIDFEQADVIVMIETVHNQCGVGLITREMKERYPFIAKVQ